MSDLDNLSDEELARTVNPDDPDGELDQIGQATDDELQERAGSTDELCRDGAALRASRARARGVREPVGGLVVPRPGR